MVSPASRHDDLAGWWALLSTASLLPFAVVAAAVGFGG
jgi:hypothetical protein